MAKHKVRKGRGGRSGERGMSTTPAASGKVLYCEGCGTTGEHWGLPAVARCWGLNRVMTGVHYRWVRR